MSTLTRSIDRKKYGRLLAKTAPVLIETEEENERALTAIERLMKKGESRTTPEEDALLGLLARLVEDFEARAYPMDDAAPREVVEFLLDQRGLKPRDLWPVLGSKSRVSEILSGKRAISKEQAKKLAEFFHVSLAAFI